MSTPINFPSAWKTQQGDILIYPIGNGYAFPVEKELPFLNKRVPAVRGWANSMGLIAIERKKCFLVCGFEKPFDMFILNKRKNGLNAVAASIDPQMGEFGYKRVFRYFIDNKLSRVMGQYRNWRASMGYIKTLEEKSKVVPEIAKLRGAANVWMWCENRISKLYGRADNPNAPKREARKIADEMKTLGMTRVLWNNFEGETAEDCEYIKSLGFLVGKYDIYRDVLPADIAHTWLTPPFPLRPKSPAPEARYHRWKHQPSERKNGSSPHPPDRRFCSPVPRDAPGSPASVP